MSGRGNARPEGASTPDLAELIRGVRFRLETARAFGANPLRSRGAAAGAEAAPAGAAEAAPAGAAAAGAAALGPGAVTGPELDEERARRRVRLEAIDREVRECRACPLCERRRNTVFGVGDPCARLLFIGEGPGREEDLRAEPFVGPAGQLLDRMIHAMGLAREQVYIANVVKCRPPGNRVPEPAEARSCLPYLRRQIDVIRPEVICTLGKTPAGALLETDAPLGRLRGRFVEFDGIPLMPTFHPAYLLRNPPEKRRVWEDLQQVMARLGLSR